MSDNATWLRSNKVIGIVLAVLVVFEVFFLVGDFPAAVRYAVAGLIAVTLVLGVTQLSRNRRG
ncbi:hypothetical protein [Micromonospora sp. SL4-19]|uniref:hypothetical protein n=1 Tax=Micromonospora sp. SL4-19 TaxID=3399129 RepID=UPI003A4DA774